MKRTKLMNILHYEIPREYQNRSDVLVCHYCTWGYGFWAIFCFVLGFIFAIGMTYGMARDAKGPEDLVLATMPIVLGAGFVALGWVFALYMKYATVIFHENGIWYRGMAGGIYEFTNEDVIGYVITDAPKHHYVTVRTKQKRIVVDIASPGYFQAKELVRQKYREM